MGETVAVSSEAVALKLVVVWICVAELFSSLTPFPASPVSRHPRGPVAQGSQDPSQNPRVRVSGEGLGDRLAEPRAALGRFGEPASKWGGWEAAEERARD